MTSERLHELKELYSKATPGEWELLSPGCISLGMKVRLSEGRVLIGYIKASFHDAHVMVAAHNAMPELLAMAEEALRLREVVEAQRELIETYEWDYYSVIFTPKITIRLRKARQRLAALEREGAS